MKNDSLNCNVTEQNAGGADDVTENNMTKLILWAAMKELSSLWGVKSGAAVTEHQANLLDSIRYTIGPNYQPSVHSRRFLRIILPDLPA